MWDNIKETSEKYGDIMDFPYQGSGTRPHMAQSNRAAQFVPFAALTGYGEAIEETQRRRCEFWDKEYQ